VDLPQSLAKLEQTSEPLAFYSGINQPRVLRRKDGRRLRELNNKDISVAVLFE